MKREIWVWEKRLLVVDDILGLPVERLVEFLEQIGFCVK